jgi:hypothetical protein
VRRRHCAAQGFQIAAAGQNAFFSLEATDPNTLAVVTDIYAFSSSAGDELRWGSSAGIVGAGTLHTARFTDARVRTTNALFAGGTPPAYELRSASLAGGPMANNLVQGRVQLPSIASMNTLMLKPEGLVLLGERVPSLASGLTLCSIVVAGTLVLTVEWDEYQLP